MRRPIATMFPRWLLALISAVQVLLGLALIIKQPRWIPVRFIGVLLLIGLLEVWVVVFDLDTKRMVKTMVKSIIFWVVLVATAAFLYLMVKRP